MKAECNLTVGQVMVRFHSGHEVLGMVKAIETDPLWDLPAKAITVIQRDMLLDRYVLIELWFKTRSGKSFPRRLCYKLKTVEDFDRNLTFGFLRRLPKFSYCKHLAPQMGINEFDPEDTWRHQVMGIYAQGDEPSFRMDCLDAHRPVSRLNRQDYDAGLDDWLSQQRLGENLLDPAHPMNIWEEKVVVHEKPLWSPEDLERFQEYEMQRQRIDSMIRRFDESIRTGVAPKGRLSWKEECIDDIPVVTWNKDSTQSHYETFITRAQNERRPLVIRKKLVPVVTPDGGIGLTYKVTGRRSKVLQDVVQVEGQVPADYPQTFICRKWKETWHRIFDAEKKGADYPKRNKNHFGNAMAVLAKQYGVELPVVRKPVDVYDLESRLEQVREDREFYYGLVEANQGVGHEMTLTEWEYVLKKLDEFERQEDRLSWDATLMWREMNDEMLPETQLTI